MGIGPKVTDLRFGAKNPVHVVYIEIARRRTVEGLVGDADRVECLFVLPKSDGADKPLIVEPYALTPPSRGT